MSQLSLEQTGVPTQPETKMTKRQRFSLELIGAAGNLPSEDLGRALHDLRFRDSNEKGGHPDTRTCPFCQAEGASMGSRLRELGLVRMRKDRGWYVPGRERATDDPPAPRDPDAYDPESAEIPF